MWEQSRSRAKICVSFLLRTIDTETYLQQSAKFQEDFKNGIFSAMMQNIMYLHEFNFYPGGEDTFNLKCCEVAFFISLTGNRWNIHKKEKVSLATMFEILIHHFNKCNPATKYAVIVTDKWDDNTYQAVKGELDLLKSIGVVIDINLAQLDKFFNL